MNERGLCASVVIRLVLRYSATVLAREIRTLTTLSFASSSNVSRNDYWKIVACYMSGPHIYTKLGESLSERNNACLCLLTFIVG